MKKHPPIPAQGPRANDRMSRRLILSLAIVLLFIPDRALSQSYRKAVGFPPTEIYQSIFNFIGQKEYAKIPRALMVLSPITDHIADKFKNNPADVVERAVERGDPAEILSSVQALLVLDIKDLLDDAGRRVEESSEDAKTHVDAARLDYELLSPFIQSMALQEDQKIRKLFSNSLKAFGTKTLYSAEKPNANPSQVKRLCAEIVAGLSEIFPQKTP